MGEKLEIKNPRISRLAVVSLILGLLSILLTMPPVGLFGLFSPLALGELLLRGLFWLSPFAALVVGILAFYQISKAKGQLKGKACAGVGIFLCALPLVMSPFAISSNIDMYAKSEIAAINNVTKETTVVLLSDKDKQKSVCGIQIYILGYIDGAATIYIINEHEHYEHEYKISSGKVGIKLSGDWYSNECLIKYEPTNVNSGHLKIRYYFDTL